MTMKSIFAMRRNSKSSSRGNAQFAQSPPSSYTPPIQGNESRPISTATSTSFDFANRPLSQSQPPAVIQPAGLSRTDLIVLRHFWSTKYQENSSRDLHFLRFPHFPQDPAHKDLVPYCEIYHLIKTQPSATIISLGTVANGVYIGFELFEGSQLHIDMDDEWTGISHFRVEFKTFEKMVADSDGEFKSWLKPLTIEYLEEQFQKWQLDLMSICWERKEVRELDGSV